MATPCNLCGHTMQPTISWPHHATYVATPCNLPYQSTGATAAQPLAPRHHSSNGNLGILPGCGRA
eukprot:365002-Chlamydomonas_euryale.AAC.2